jgi:Peptidase family M23
VVFRSDNSLRFALVIVVFVLALALPRTAAAWSWPVDGPVLRGFSTDDDPYGGGQHRGIDVGAPVGSDVQAPASGVVSFAGSVPGAGRAVTIRTQDGYSITLLQLASIAVPVRTAVVEGDVVGAVGTSVDERVPDPHVHLGIRLTAEPHGYVDPLSLLPVRQPRAGEPAPPPAPVSAPAPDPLAAPAPAPELPAAKVGAPPPPGSTATPAPPRAVQPPPRPLRSPRPPAEVTSPRRSPPSGRPVRTRGMRTAVVPGRTGGTRTARAGLVMRPNVGRPLPGTPIPDRMGTNPGGQRRSSEAKRHAREDEPSSAWLLGLACVGLALCAFGAKQLVRRARAGAREVEENVLRKMSAVPTGPEETHPESHPAASPRLRRLALCERPAAHRPCRRLRGSLRHLRALSPASGQPRAHGQRHRRARNAGHGRGRSRGGVPA